MLDVGETVLVTFAPGDVRAGEIVNTNGHDNTVVVRAFRGLPRPFVTVPPSEVEEIERSTCERLGLLGN